MVDIERGSEADVRVAVGVLMVHTGLASMSRGAELAGVPYEEFRELFDGYDAHDTTGLVDERAFKEEFPYDK